MSQTFIQTLRETVDAEWAQIKQGEFWRHVMSEPVSRPLYRDLMLQIYHYSRHNSMNQAVAAFVPAPEGLLKFVYRHAAEELGHERMVTHDLNSIGLLDEADLAQAPLPATEALIGYLYYVALRYGPIARLGYSFWAEGVYGHIAGPFAKISQDLKLTSKNLTFFGSHAQADEAHIQQVEEAIERFATTPADQALVVKVARTTLSLTGQLLDQVARLHRAPPGSARP
jgi:thiaminase